MYEEINNIADQIKLKSNSISKLYQEKDILNKQLYSKLDILLADVNNSPLKEDTWIVEYYNSDVFLCCTNHNSFKMLRKYYEKDSHCIHNILNEQYNLHFSDGDIDISANGDNNIFELVKKLNLTYVDKTKQNIENIEKEIKELENKKEQFLQILKKYE